jgi:hypothetical protein
MPEVATVKRGAGSIQSMPIGVHDAGRLTNLADDKRQLLIGKSEHVDRNVKNMVRREFRGESPRDDVQILETFNDARDRAGVSVRDDLKPPPRIGWGRIH